MFKRARNIQSKVSILFDGQPIAAEEGETVAAALFAAGILSFRQAPEDDSPRGPYCMIGNCFECLIEIEGLGGRQACQTRVRDGMVIARHRGLATVEAGS